MPYPHFDKTIAAIDQPWFLGPQVGPGYVQNLSRRFNNSIFKPQIDTALSLGDYLVHSDSNQQKRLAVRAVMLAYFLQDSSQLSLRDALKDRLNALELNALKRALVNRFDALQDGNSRQSWSPLVLSDPGDLQDNFSKISNGKKQGRATKFQFIVHGVKDYTGEVFNNPQILTRYEVLSMSLMSNLNTHSYTDQGVILRVPSNNILLASPQDVQVQNYAKGFDAANPGNSTISSNLMEISVRSEGLSTPFYLDSNPKGYPYYNEVVVCGKTGIPLPHGLTGTMNTVGVFILTDETGKLRGSEATASAREKAARQCAKKYDLPLLYIPNYMDRAGS